MINCFDFDSKISIIY